MYRLSQWAGDFPMLWEPHGSFTPLFTSQPEELAFSKSVSLRLHISASCPVFLCSVLFFSSFFPPLVWTPAQAAQISRTAVLSWSSSSHVTTDTQTRSQPMLVKLFYPIMIDHVRIQSGILRSRSGADEKSPPDNTCRFLQLPALSLAPCFSFTQLVESHLVWLTMSLIFFFSPLLFFGQTFSTVHWQILYKIAI